MSAPQLLSRKANGVQPVAKAPAASSGVAATAASTTATDKTKPKPTADGEKVIVRRLPPGLTEAEFTAILGDYWKPGNGRVGWCSFHAGKVSTE